MLEGILLAIVGTVIYVILGCFFSEYGRLGREAERYNRARRRELGLPEDREEAYRYAEDHLRRLRTQKR
jgi:hypothetical protein